MQNSVLSQFKVMISGYEALDLLGQGAFSNVWLVTSTSSSTSASTTSNAFNTGSGNGGSACAHPQTKRSSCLSWPKTSNTPSKTLFAAKVLKDASEGARKMEIEAWRSCMEHEGVIKLLDVQETLDSKQTALITEYYPKMTTLKRYISKKGKLKTNKVKKILFNLATAVLHCHRSGWAHNDLNLTNILIHNSSSLRLIDFGKACPLLPSALHSTSTLSAVKTSSSFPSSNSVMSSPMSCASQSSFVSDCFSSNSGDIADMLAVANAASVSGSSSSDGQLCTDYVGCAVVSPPEKFLRRPYDASKADSWSLGVICYKLLFGLYPINARTDEEIGKKIINFHFKELKNITTLPESLQQVLRGLLEPDPSRRLSISQLLVLPWFTKTTFL